MADDKGSTFSSITTAFEQAMKDVRSLQQFVGRLVIAANHSNPRDDALRDFRSREGAGIKNIIADITGVVSNLRANMDELESEIVRHAPAKVQYPIDRRSSRPVREHGPVLSGRSDEQDVPVAASGSEMRLGDLRIIVPAS